MSLMLIRVPTPTQQVSTVFLAGTHYAPGATSQVLFLLSFLLVRLMYFPFYLWGMLASWGAFLSSWMLGLQQAGAGGGLGEGCVKKGRMELGRQVVA